MMQTMRHLKLAGLVCAALLSACDYEKNAVQDITVPTPPTAGVKFFNFGVNAPGVNFYANDQKLTAISSTTGAESTNGTTFGNVGSGGFYNGVNPGTYTFTGKIAAATDKDLAISNLSSQVADGKYYSYYISGLYNTTSKTADAFIVEDVLPETDSYPNAYVRFVNAIYNSNPQQLSVKSTVSGAVTTIGSAVAYKNAGAFVAIPGGVYDISTREAGASADAITRTAVSFNAGRVYTISSRGSMTLTDATNRPFLDNTANR